VDNTNLVREIIAEMQTNERKAISFYRYMQLCLYHPEHGYYSRTFEKIGKKGDFYTSSNVGTLMGEMLAVYISERLNKPMPGTENQICAIIEWGAGTGRLAGQLLDELQLNYESVYNRTKYTIVEQSPYHIQVQKDLLTRHKDKIDHKSPEQWFSINGQSSVVVISNELLDAFPVHRFIYMPEGWREVYVSWDPLKEQFTEKYDEPDHMSLEYISKYIDKPTIMQHIEVNLDADRWIGQVACTIQSGTVITIDYGDVAEELYAKHRMKGTFMCYHKHQASDTPYERTGLQDMTAHINFSACIDVGERNGLKQAKLMTQKQFLLEAGILNKLQEHAFGDPFHPVAKRNRSIRQLLLSDQMSELFKVLIQSK
jgi:SAM-dependent MidA family methyltransferase